MRSWPHYITFIQYQRVRYSESNQAYRGCSYKNSDAIDWTYELDKIIPFLRTFPNLYTLEFRGVDLQQTIFTTIDTVPGIRHLLLHDVDLPTAPTNLVLQNIRLTSLDLGHNQGNFPLSLLGLPTLRVVKFEWNLTTACEIATWICGSPVEEYELQDVALETWHKTLPLDEVHIDVPWSIKYDDQKIVNPNLWLFLRACSTSLQRLYIGDKNDHLKLNLDGPPVQFPKLHTFTGSSRLGALFGGMIFKNNPSLRVVAFDDEAWIDNIEGYFGYYDEPQATPTAVQKLEIWDSDKFCWGACDFLRDMFPDLEEFYCEQVYMTCSVSFLKELGTTHLAHMPKLWRFAIRASHLMDDEWDREDIGALVKEWGKWAPALRVVSLTKEYEWRRTRSDDEWVKHAVPRRGIRGY
ncbi:hypothetical protein Moror_2273 [Moniliophthora roreri MCA 2997]|uniref:F-box domain-containing protein n=1 Tax=Moniliophthora roreri (strain MCA 2997) TaxID=1381753 RepID=V2XP07_MONRO|nr:hypothetical protein Moror_2273 [Moniliophthora roreri MCA 2997]